MRGMSVSGRIFALKRFAVHDGPGIRTTVFMKGCPLRCRWCHNPEGIKTTPEIGYIKKNCIGCGSCVKICKNGVYMPSGGELLIKREKCAVCTECVGSCFADALILYGESVDSDYIMEKIIEDKEFYITSGGGVTLSGGEPLMQAEFSAAILKSCVANKIHTALDTSGYASWDAFELLIPYVNLFLYDIKHIDESRHIKYTGVSNKLIIENLKKLDCAGVPIEIRIPLIPDINDGEEHIRNAGELLSGIKNMQAIKLLKYHALAKSKYAELGLPEAMPETSTDANERMTRCEKLLKSFGINVIIS
jgi:pyruvate formate lyase activating enzyme